MSHQISVIQYTQYLIICSAKSIPQKKNNFEFLGKRIDKLFELIKVATNEQVNMSLRLHVCNVTSADSKAMVSKVEEWEESGTEEWLERNDNNNNYNNNKYFKLVSKP